jgi:hypothetical protein
MTNKYNILVSKWGGKTISVVGDLRLDVRILEDDLVKQNPYVRNVYNVMY